MLNFEYKANMPIREKEYFYLFKRKVCFLSRLYIDFLKKILIDLIKYGMMMYKHIRQVCYEY